MTWLALALGVGLGWFLRSRYCPMSPVPTTDFQLRETPADERRARRYQQ